MYWPVACATHATNYGGPLRASDAMNKGTSYSLARLTGESGRRLGEGRRCHDERICFTSATPDYVGPFRPETRVCETENHELPTMLRMGFDQTVIFSQN